MELRLQSGDRVCIVGGGPAGSFAALHLLRFAHQQNIDLEVLIFEPRDFSHPGPGGCNRCAGILSSRVQSGLASLGLELPENVIQSELQAYALKLNDKEFRIERPDPTRRILSVYRGGGPRLLLGEPVSSFDGYLLSQACDRGAQHIKSRVRTIDWDGHPVIQTSRKQFSANFLVLATGVNSRSPLLPHFGYRPPQTDIMAQDEIMLPNGWPLDQVTTYFHDPPGLIFGAMTPKGRYLNISLLGKHLATDAVSEFLMVQNIFEDLHAQPESLCGCTPRIAISPAKGYYGDRWVAVGDSAVTRLYKDGIGSAYQTAKTAMQVAVGKGISSGDFQRAYSPVCRRVARDNLYGKLIFRIWTFTLNNPKVLQAWVGAVQSEKNSPPNKRVYTRLLWGMFTGDEPYRDLFWLSLKATTLNRLWPGLLKKW